MVRLSHLFLLTVCWCSTGECAKILVFLCDFVKSHHLVFHPIIKELAVRGHEVDFYTHYPIDDSPNTLKQISFPQPNMSRYMPYSERFRPSDLFFSQLAITTLKRIGQFSFVFDDCFSFPSVVELFASNQTYDLVIGEFSVLQEELTVLLHKFNAPGVSMLSAANFYWANELNGMSTDSSLMIETAGSEGTSIFKRVKHYVDIQLSKLVDYFCLVVPAEKRTKRLFKYEGWETRPSVAKLASNMALVLVSSHHSLGYSLPQAPNVKEVLGVHVHEHPPPLPEDIQNFMDGAENGVIYFSLGSMASVQLLKINSAFEPLLLVFSKLPQKVLWKWTSWSGEEPPAVSNIKFVKWAPQQSILAHNKTKLFITHGGLGSLTEAVAHGVPMIGIPLMSDQPKNMKLVVNLGVAIKMDVGNMNEESISKAVNEALHNPRYKQEALKRAEMYHDRPMKPLDEAVYWIEYVLRHGNVLQPAAAQMPFYQLYLLDVIGFVVICLFAFVYLCRLVFRQLGRAIWSVLFENERKMLVSKSGSRKRQ